MSFTLSPAIGVALLTGFLQPVILLFASRVPALKGKAALQFLIGALVSYGLWLSAIALFAKLRPQDLIEFVVGSMAVTGAALAYLEVWGLMSRGYTLAIMLTLLRAGKPLCASEVARAYRGGDGLDWIVRHRITGLETSWMVHRIDQRLVLTPFPGVLIAYLHRFSISILGLRKTG